MCGILAVFGKTKITRSIVVRSRRSMYSFDRDAQFDVQIPRIAPEWRFPGPDKVVRLLPTENLGKGEIPDSRDVRLQHAKSGWNPVARKK